MDTLFRLNDDCASAELGRDHKSAWVAARQRSFCGCKSSAPIKDVTDDAVSSSTMVRQYRQILASAEMALLQYGQIFVSNVLALPIGSMNGMRKCRSWLDLNRRKKKACTIIPANAKIIVRNTNSFPTNPTMRIAKLEKNNISNASERARTTAPYDRLRGGAKHSAIASEKQIPSVDQFTMCQG
jgi:hypothetical protein